MTLTGVTLQFKNKYLESRVIELKSKSKFDPLDITPPLENSQYQMVSFDDIQIPVYETNTEKTTQIVTANNAEGAFYIISQAIDLGAPQLIYVETLHPSLSIDPNDPTVQLNAEFISKDLEQQFLSMRKNILNNNLNKIQYQDIRYLFKLLKQAEFLS